jgi:hypothetical protein
MTTQITTIPQQQQIVPQPSRKLDKIAGPFSSVETFETYMRMAKLLMASSFLPSSLTQRGTGDNKEWLSKEEVTANCVIVLEIANKLDIHIMAVLQSIHVVHGRPGYSSKFLISALSQCDRFSPLRFVMAGEGMTRSCYAWVVEKATGERLEGPPVSIEMAKAEGWYDKKGSKWKTMPELMLRYRAASFLVNLYAPDVVLGMHSVEELEDISEVTQGQPGLASSHLSPAAMLQQLLDADPLPDTTEEPTTDEPPAPPAEEHAPVDLAEKLRRHLGKTDPAAPSDDDVDPVLPMD